MRTDSSRRPRDLTSIAIALLALGILYAGARAEPARRVLPLPGEFAAYRSWKRLLDQPKEVPIQQWTACMAPSLRPAAAPGPHTQKVIQVYANQDAQKALKNSGRKAFPPGSMIAKEKMEGSGSGTAFAGVAFMVKRSAGEFAESGGWEFRYFPGGDEERAQTHEACATCHRNAADKDYVFGDYKRK